MGFESLSAARRAHGFYRLLPLLLFGWLANPSVSADDLVKLETVMDVDPEVVLTETEPVFSDKLLPLWVEALQQPDSDFQRQAAETITRAHEKGMAGLSESSSLLIKTLQKSDAHPALQLACARALVALGIEEAAEPLFAVTKEGSLDMALLVEPALARWRYAPIRAIWLTNIKDVNCLPQRLKLAAQGLGMSGDQNAAAAIRERLVDADQQYGDAASSRLVLARSLARLHTEGLEDDARGLAGKEGPAHLVDRLVASQLLSQHESQATSELLGQLAVDPLPVVASAALERLMEINPDKAIEPGLAALESPDAKLRGLGIQSIAHQADKSVVDRLAEMMNDNHTEVRTQARTVLVELAQADAALDPLIRAAAEAMLGTDFWRGQQQAILLLVALDHKRAAGRLVQLLDFPRPESYVTAAWALRELRVPTALPAMFRKADRAVRAGATSGMEPGGPEDLQCCYLLEAFGLMGYEEAEDLLWRCVPKNYDLGAETRAAGIWSLGKLSMGKRDDKLAAAMVARLTDVEELFVEIDRVRFMAAITLGRLQYAETSDATGIKAQALEALKKYFNRNVVTPLDFSCGWAIGQIDGEPIARLAPRKVFQMGWFLEPLEP